MKFLLGSLGGIVGERIDSDLSKNLKSFDLIIDFKSEQKTEICDDITEKMKQTYPEYDFTVILDSDLSD